MRVNPDWAIGLALVLDLLCGDPPNRLHPVAWMGSAIAAAKRHAPATGNGQRFAYGLALDVAGVLAAAGAGHLVEHTLAHIPTPLRWLGRALALKLTLSLHGLGAAAQEVRAALAADDLPEARRLLSWHLVSRDTSALNTSQVAAAAIESVAENTSDGIIAPLFYHAVGGLPAALAYRFLNTADAMLGYHDAEHEWLGKAPARLDDLANLLPARLTALLIIAAAHLGGADGRRAWQVWRRDRARTASPNAGHPMSAMAGALDVELAKAGHYCLGSGQHPATATDIGRATRLMAIATALGAGLLMGLPLARRLFARR